MVIILKEKTSMEEAERLSKIIERSGKIQVHPVFHNNIMMLGLTGDTSSLDKESIEIRESVEKVVIIKEPYKRSNRIFNPNDTIIDICGNKIGGDNFTVIAGPCSVESKEQILSIAGTVKEAGAKFLRGGAYKPRTSPYSFQGLKSEGLDYLIEARAKEGIPIVTEIMSPYDIERFAQDVDVIQVGARNMQNFDLLKELGKIKNPILLKRGLSATIEELLMAAEYIMSEGNTNVILCERGIRTFENYTRNTLDISAVPILKKLSHLPVVVDPSHSAGKWWLVEPLSKAALVVGADGIIVEVHNEPKNALCDGEQSIKPERFQKLMGELRVIGNAIGKEI